MHPLPSCPHHQVKLTSLRKINGKTAVLQVKSDFPTEERSAAKLYDRPHAHGVQFSAQPLPGEVVGQPFRHMAADLQVRHGAVLGWQFIFVFWPQGMTVLVKEEEWRCIIGEIKTVFWEDDSGEIFILNLPVWLSKKQCALKKYADSAQSFFFRAQQAQSS